MDAHAETGGKIQAVNAIGAGDVERSTVGTVGITAVRHGCNTITPIDVPGRFWNGSGTASQIDEILIAPKLVEIQSVQQGRSLYAGNEA